jgi:hypothetical protein
MPGNFRVEKGHGGVSAHLDHAQWAPEVGAIKERYAKDGTLIDIRFQPSNDFAKELGMEARNYPLSGVSASLVRPWSSISDELRRSPLFG